MNECLNKTQKVIFFISYLAFKEVKLQTTDFYNGVDTGVAVVYVL